MKRKRAVVFALVLFVSLFQAGHQICLAAGKAHVLLVSDTLDGRIGRGIVINRDNLVDLFNSSLPQERVSLTVIDGQSVDWPTISRTIASLRVTREDTLFCHFSGHGGFDPKVADTDPEQGHILFLHRGSVTRTEFINTLLAKRARLTVLISDSCFTRIYGPPSEELEAAWLRKINVLLESLLFDWRGVVDVNGASRDTACWYSWNLQGGGPGGWFTSSLVEEISLGEETKKPWTDFMSAVSDRTSETYKQWKEVFLQDPGIPADIKAALAAQDDQRPQALRPLEDLTAARRWPPQPVRPWRRWGPGRPWRR